MKTTTIIIVLALAVLIIGSFVMTRRSRHGSLVAERIKIDGLKSALKRLKNGETEYDFIGIISNGIDCLYIVPKNDRFNIEFEAMLSEQLPYMEKITRFCAANSIKCTTTTYGNKPHYPSETTAPVLQIELNATMDVVVDVTKRMQKEIFNNNDETVYDVVP